MLAGGLNILQCDINEAVNKTRHFYSTFHWIQYEIH